MLKYKLTSPATRPGYIVIEAVASADGGTCLVVNCTRIAGGKPASSANNVRYRWNVREENLRRVLDNSD